VNAGLSILPHGNVAAEVKSGDLAFARFRDPAPWVRQLGVVLRRGRAASPAERSFLALLPSSRK